MWVSSASPPREVRALLVAYVGSLRSIFWIATLVFIEIYLFAVIGVFLYGREEQHMYDDDAFPDAFEDALGESIAAYFGSVQAAMATLLQVRRRRDRAARGRRARGRATRVWYHGLARRWSLVGEMGRARRGCAAMCGVECGSREPRVAGPHGGGVMLSMNHATRVLAFRLRFCRHGMLAVGATRSRRRRRRRPSGYCRCSRSTTGSRSCDRSRRTAGQRGRTSSRSSSLARSGCSTS
jgi:hypothetical protein